MADNSSIDTTRLQDIMSRSTSLGVASWDSLVVTNLDEASTVFIVLEKTGNLVLFYEVEINSTEAKQFYIWHQGGTTTPINLGLNQVDVNAKDMIVYQLADPSKDCIQFYYAVQEASTDANEQSR